MPQETIRLDATKFIKFLKQLQKEFRPPTSLAKIMEGETLAMMKGSARRTGRTTRAKAGGKYNPGSKFFKGWVKLNGKKYYCGPTKNGLKGFRYPDALWAKLQARLKANRKRAEARVGLSKAVYYQASANLGLPRYSMGWADGEYIKTSRSKSGGLGSPAKSGPQWPGLIKTSKKLKGNSPTLKIRISAKNTFNPFTQGAGAMKKAMAARGRNFEVALEKGAFKDTKKLAGFYPNILVKI